MSESLAPVNSSAWGNEENSFERRIRITLPRNLIRLRQQHNMSQAELARRSGVSAATLNLLERGEAGDLMLSTLVAFSEAFEVSLDYLYPPSLKLACVDVALWPCGGCGLMGKHSFRECLWAMHLAQRSSAFMSARLGLTVRSIESIIQDEYNVISGRRV